ncbi:transporter substrate-binding domain-containing protein [Alphaproteobacteria bacterium KMM 3653]|uniref:histidine kinase n=1 Tax=Harenicola maris TaxID=2841044 RepID=A0AAP2CNP7_9RHOB|nr:transporter substrate-binding domain-containing protein [Harenicola maris]
MFTIWKLPVFGLVWLTIFTVLTFAQEGEDGEVIRVAYEEFAPYSFTGSDGQARGLSIDLIRRLATSAGMGVTFVPSRNPAQSIEMLKTGEAEVTGLLALTEPRLAVALPTQELGAFELRAFVLRGSPARNPNDLSGFRIGVVAGSFSVQAAQKVPFVELVTYEETDALVLGLLMGEVDAVVSAGDSFLGRLRLADVEGLTRVLDPPLTSSPRGYLIAPDRTDLQTSLDQAIAAEITPHELDLLNQRWFGRSKTVFDSAVFWWVSAAAVLGAIALACFAYYAHVYRKSSERLLRENAANDLLITALDEISPAIVIYDDELNAVHWNRGVKSAFPELVDLLEQGATMQGLLMHSFDVAEAAEQMGAAERAAQADAIVQALRRDQETVRTIRTPEGRVFEAREFPLGPRYFASTKVDITRLQHQQDTILAQSDRLEEANGQLRTFAAIAAHDLKAPLNQQKALLSFIHEDIQDAGMSLPEEVQEQWDMVEGLSRRMTQLIEDLLIYARAETEDLEGEWIDPEARLREVVKLATVREGFEVSVTGGMPRALVNPTAFDMVMRNLISNAVKHHDREAGHVDVSASLIRDALHFRVQDDGPGIAPEDREKIFEAFSRLTLDVEGSGLGLAYTKKTVERWGGRIWVEPAPERGSIFTITIPQRAEVVPFAETAGAERPAGPPALSA